MKSSLAKEATKAILKDHWQMSDGFLSYNPITNKYELAPFHESTHYPGSMSIGKKTYFEVGYEDTIENSYMDENKKWGYVNNVLYRVLDTYWHKSGKPFYLLRIEVMI